MPMQIRRAAVIPNEPVNEQPGRGEDHLFGQHTCMRPHQSQVQPRCQSSITADLALLRTPGILLHHAPEPLEPGPGLLPDLNGRNIRNGDRCPDHLPDGDQSQCQRVDPGTQPSVRKFIRERS